LSLAIDRKAEFQTCRCIRRHLERAAQLEDDDAGLQLFFVKLAKKPSVRSAKFWSDPESLHDAPSLETPLSLGRALARASFRLVGKLTNHANAGAERIEEGVSHPVGTIGAVF